MRRLAIIAALGVLAMPLVGVAQEATEPTDADAELEALEPAVSVSDVPTMASAAGADRRVVRRGEVMDEIDLGRTEITGNQELPKVLYIVPWKQSDLGDLVGRPVNSLLDEVLAPVDREVFVRQVDYYQSLYVDPAVGAESGE